MLSSLRVEGVVLGVALVGLGVLITLANFERLDLLSALRLGLAGAARAVGNAGGDRVAGASRVVRSSPMRAAKIGLLFLILMFGAGIETAWQVREQFGIGPMGCQVLGGRLYGTSHVSGPRSVRLCVPANITLLDLPAYSPELNPMENVWEFLRGNKLSALVWDTYDAIVDACVSAWHFLIGDPERIRSIGTRDWACVSL